MYSACYTEKQDGTIDPLFCESMHLLVDGHNLIGQTPGMSLSDPNDEAKLVMLLRHYATAKRGRQVVVVFDKGVYGHPQSLNGYGVVCFFARSPQDADTQLIRRIYALKRPSEWAVVTSDRQVARAAEDRGVRVISSKTFATQLRSPKKSQPLPDEELRDFYLSDAEVAEWMRLFGEQPEVTQEPEPGDEVNTSPPAPSSALAPRLQKPKHTKSGKRRRKR